MLHSARISTTFNLAALTLLLSTYTRIAEKHLTFKQNVKKFLLACMLFHLNIFSKYYKSS